MMHLNGYILRICLITIFITCGAIKNLQAQDNKAEQLLLQQCQSAANETEKVYRLYELINFYYAFNFERKADSLREIQIITAQESGNQS